MKRNVYSSVGDRHGMRARSGAAAEIATRMPPQGNPAKRTVLMIDYFFPPLAGAGVQRTLNYVKHLGEFGWDPIVLTVAEGDDLAYDVSLLDRIPPGVNIERTASLEPIRFIRRLISVVRGRRGARESGRHDGRPTWAGAGARWIQIFDRWFLFPDRRVGWLPFAVARGLAIHRRQRIDVIYSTSTSVTSHVIATVLSTLLGKPWVADFQDWWAEDRAGPACRWAAKRLEYTIVRRAERTTFTTEPLRQWYQRKYPTIPPHKLVAIPMGFDPEVFQGITPISRSKFTMVHFGSFYATRSPGPFLEALAECVKSHRGLADDVEVLFYGRFDADMMRLTERLIRDGGLTGIVRLQGIVPYKLGLQQLMSADVLLLVTGPGPSGEMHIPSKLYEYLATGRAILALAPPGGAAGIVQEARAGVIVHPNDVEGIREAVLGLYQRWTQRRLVFPMDPAVVEKYTGREIARRFTETLESALAQQR